MTPKQAAAYWFTQSELSPLGQGHIHDTFLLTVSGRRYVLQRVNQVVLVDPALVMRQTARVLQQWRRQSQYQIPQLIPTAQDEPYLREEGEVWRVWSYIEPSRVVDPLANPEQASLVAAAFGSLQQQLCDLTPQFEDPISHFLQLQHYLAVFEPFAHQAPKAMRRLIDQQQHLAERFAQRNCHIHGDCKVNNVLFDTSGRRVVAVIDFDTAMYGHWAWDFGDLVRSVCFSQGGLDADYFAACVRGFAPHQPLFDAELACDAPSYVALMLGVRFLTDHLTGDHYFRVAHAGQNLQRAQQQFDLCQQFVSARAQLLGLCRT